MDMNSALEGIKELNAHELNYIIREATNRLYGELHWPLPESVQEVARTKGDLIAGIKELRKCTGIGLKAGKDALEYFFANDEDAKAARQKLIEEYANRPKIPLNLRDYCVKEKYEESFRRQVMPPDMLPDDLLPPEIV